MSIWSLLLLTAAPVSACDPQFALEGKNHFEAGRFPQAEEAFRRAVQQNCPSSQLLSGRLNLAAVLRERNRNEESLRWYLESEHLLAGASQESRMQYWAGRALSEEQAGRRTSAEVSYKQALTLLPLVSTASALRLLSNYMAYWLRQGRLGEAAHAQSEAMRQPGWNHERPFAMDLNRAELLRMQGRPAAAERVLRAALADGSGTPVLRAVAYNNLAKLASARKRTAEAEQLWARALEAWKDAYGPRHPTVARALNNLAAHHVARKNYKRAESLYRESIAIAELPEALNNLAALYHTRRRYDEAEQLYRRVLRMYQSSVPMREAIQPRGNLAILLVETGRTQEAMEQFREVVALLAVAVPADEAVAGRILELYERLLRRRMEAAEAERIGAMAMRYRVRTALRNQKETPRSQSSHGGC
jgi:tetratricopeptide (TPR) repeat protein